MINIDKISASKSTALGVVSILLFSCFLMFFVDVYMPLEYFQKSFVKIILFFILPIAYCLYNKNISLQDYFKVKSKKQLLLSVLLGIGVYIFILVAFFIAKNFINLDSISTSLEGDLNISGNNFIYVAIYISFINSLLEEFFFRGFAFLSLSKITSKRFAYLFSSFSFSFYHIAIMLGWFNIFIFLLILFGLVIAGNMFNWLNEKSGNIYNSWLVHMFANFAINSIGIWMFYM